MFVRNLQSLTETLAVGDKLLWSESAKRPSVPLTYLLNTANLYRFITCNNFRYSNVVLLRWLLCLIKLKSSIERRLGSWPLPSIILTHCLTDRPQTMAAPEKVLHSIFRLWFSLYQPSEILATLTFLQERGRLVVLVLLQLRVICVSSVILVVTAKGKVAGLTGLCSTELLNWVWSSWFIWKTLDPSLCAFCGFVFFSYTGIILLKAVWKEDAGETICATRRGSRNVREKYSRSGTVRPMSLIWPNSRG